MSESSDARVAFAKKVKNGEYTLGQAKAELERMEARYGKDAFLAGSVVRKEPPWTMEYLEELNKEAIAGSGSKDFLYHMAEVSDAVYSKKRLLKGLAIVGSIVAAIALIGVIFAVMKQCADTVAAQEPSVESAVIQRQQISASAMQEHQTDAATAAQQFVDPTTQQQINEEGLPCY